TMSTTAGRARVAVARNSAVVGSSSTSRIRGIIAAYAPVANLAAMPARILTLLALLALTAAPSALARTLVARAATVSTPVATLQDVEVRLAWPEGAAEGDLRIFAARAHAPDLGYRFARLAWRCPLRRDGDGGWACDGEVRSAGGGPLRLALELPADGFSVALSDRQGARLGLAHADAAPDLYRIDMARVPVAWAQALAAQGWRDVRLGEGRLDGRLRLRVPRGAPMRIEGPLALSGGAFDSADGRFAGAGLGAALELDWLSLPQGPVIALGGALHGGELLL